ncbi:rho GTPase-activating protein 6-like isoform X2 [Brachyhypopomus gauderio]|uniref:rho GTPase-activating protein 6-like isoform X2 n=1 Tax=Brachyhypopomus gauderio TaxID=698409 RepID=UPI004041FB99
MGDRKYFDSRIHYIGDFTWRSECGRSFRLMPVALQSLSELERVRLQDVAFTRLLQDYDLGCQITIPKDGHKTKKSLKSKLDSLSKEKRDKEYVPQAFAVTLQQVIANDRWLKLRQEAQDYEDQKEHVDLAASSLYLVRRRLNQREFSSSNSSLSSCCETPNESATPGTPESRPHARRRGGVSVDCITDLDDGQSRLLEALQLSLPAESLSTKKKARDTKLSLNPIYRQVPRVVDWCCRHLETYGLQTVGIFRVGSSRKRVRQLREEFDQGVEVDLGPEHSVHDVAALLKEFLRDMPDPLLTRELYTAFINCTLLDAEEQNTVLQLLVCLLPACNSDTLQCILHFLSKVAAHAEDSHDREGRQLTGNKMTSHNLATILGPNILHKRKSSDKEFSVQTSAQVEDSAAIISVVQRMITCHTALFTVPAELQHEVLVSLVETDYDVVDYLLRRKTSHRESPTTPHQRQPLCLSKCGSSSDSNRASSGETSPYDNASPTLSQRLLSPEPGYSGLRPSPERSLLNRPVSAETSLPPAPRHTLTEAFPSHLGNKKSLRRTQTTAEETRPHPPVTRAHSSPLSDRPLDQMCQSPTTPPWQRRTTSAWYQSDESVLASPMSPFSARYNGRLPPPYTGLPKPPSSTLQTSAMSHQPPSSTLQPTEGLNFHGPRCTPTSHGGPPTPTCPQTYTSHPAVGGCQDWQTDKWQIWHLLSSDNPDTPETLV